LERRFDQSLQADRQRANVQADAAAEDRIREDRNSIDLEQNGRVPQPRRMQAGIGPGAGIRMMGRGQNRTPAFLRVLPPESRRGALRESPQAGETETATAKSSKKH
jgi:hypothetical protein